MSQYEKTLSTLDNEINDLQVFDKELQEVSQLLIEEILSARKSKDKASFKSLTRNPEYLNAISNLLRVRADTKKSIIKSLIDKVNLMKKIDETIETDNSNIINDIIKGILNNPNDDEGTMEVIKENI